MQRRSTLKKRKASIITKLVVLAVIGYAVVTLVSLSAKIETAESARQALQKEVEQKREQNAALAYSIEHSDEVETIKKVAREKLGLAMPGEIIFYDVSN